MFHLDGFVIKKYFANWKQIGTELGLKPDMLESIKSSNPLQLTLYRWLQSTPNATWRSLEVALTNVERRKLGLYPVDDVYQSIDSYHGKCILVTIMNMKALIVGVDKTVDLETRGSRNPCKFKIF